MEVKGWGVFLGNTFSLLKIYTIYYLSLPENYLVSYPFHETFEGGGGEGLLYGCERGRLLDG